MKRLLTIMLTLGLLSTAAILTGCDSSDDTSGKDGSDILNNENTTWWFENYLGPDELFDIDPMEIEWRRYECEVSIGVLSNKQALDRCLTADGAFISGEVDFEKEVVLVVCGEGYAVIQGKQALTWEISKNLRNERTLSVKLTYVGPTLAAHDYWTMMIPVPIAVAQDELLAEYEVSH